MLTLCATSVPKAGKRRRGANVGQMPELTRETYNQSLNLKQGHAEGTAAPEGRQLAKNAGRQKLAEGASDGGRRQAQNGTNL